MNDSCYANANETSNHIYSSKLGNKFISNHFICQLYTASSPEDVIAMNKCTNSLENEESAKESSE